VVNTKQARPAVSAPIRSLRKTLPAGETAAGMIACKHSALLDDGGLATNDTAEGPSREGRTFVTVGNGWRVMLTEPDAVSPAGS
jgi:hypothetical protein